MMMFIFFITLLTLAANMIGIISGFGVSTVMTPILLFLLPYPETLLFVCIIHWFHDIWKMSFFIRSIDWRLFLLFGIPTIGATLLGAFLVLPEPSVLLSSLFGLFLVLSVGAMYIKPILVIPHNWFTGVLGGALSGFFAGMFGIRGAFRSIFFVALNVPKRTFIGTTGAISLALDSTRLATYFARGLRLHNIPLWSLFIFVPVSLLGSYIGYCIVGKIPQKQFRMVVAIFLFIVGIKLLITPWFMD